MAYIKTNWVNGTTPANATNMNKIEDELETLDTTTTELDTEIDIINDKIAGTTLYDNSTGTTSNITLSETISNFSKVKIIGYLKYSTSDEKISFSREYDVVDGITNYEILGSCYNGSTNTYLLSQINIISGTSLNRGACYQLQIGSSTARTTATGIYITKIVGFE